MPDVEVISWRFVSAEWEKMKRMPLPDRGFEESFRDYLYRRLYFGRLSGTRDTGLGLSYATLSGAPHELDVICARENNLFVFELKHYSVSNLTKDIVFTFLGKVIDFYLKNIEGLRSQKITMYLMTINRSIDDTVRKLCVTYGIKLIEPSLMTFKTLDHYVRDLYIKIPDGDTSLKTEVGELVTSVSRLREEYDYTFSDIFRCRDEGVVIELPFSQINPTDALGKLKELNATLERELNRWRSQRN